MTRRRAAWWVVVAGSVLVGACGIEPEQEARTFDAEAVPFGLLEGGPPTPPLPVEGLADGEIPVEVYLVGGDGGLTGVPRRLPAVADLAGLVDLLVEGPADLEAAFGLRTALSAGQVAEEITTVRGAAVVDLTEAFSEISQEDQAAAIAQLVFTLTTRPGIGRVAFTLEGEAIEVPRGDGSLTADPLTRDDFPDGVPGVP